MTKSYERVTFTANGYRQTVYLQMPKERTTQFGVMLTGTEVDAEGEVRWFGRGKNAGQVMRDHVIDVDCIVRRTPMRMDMELGLLVEAGS